MYMYIIKYCRYMCSNQRRLSGLVTGLTPSRNHSYGLTVMGRSRSGTNSHGNNHGSSTGMGGGTRSWDRTKLSRDGWTVLIDRRAAKQRSSTASVSGSASGSASATGAGSGSVGGGAGGLSTNTNRSSSIGIGPTRSPGSKPTGFHTSTSRYYLSTSSLLAQY